MAFPEPELGLVISYSYLWSEEAQEGDVEGRKNRACAIVLVAQQSEGQSPVVTVTPITDSPPRNLDAAIEIPSAVKRHLGMDDHASWIVADDFNVFSWSGFDLRPVAGEKNRYAYGFLPPKLFAKIVSKFAELRRQGKINQTSRDDEA